MTPGAFSGGTDAKTQDDHLEVSADGQGSWSWFKQALTYELTAADDGKYFRAFSLCMEEGLDSVSGASAAIGPVTTPIVYDELVVGGVSVTGDPIVGYTLTCSEPTITGGSGDVQVIYYWQDANNKRVLYMSGNTQKVMPVDVGRTLCCQVVVTDRVTSEQKVVVSNSVGPINRPAMPEFDVWVNGELHEDPSADVGVLPGGQVVLEVRPEPQEYQPLDIAYQWKIRTGTGRLSGDEDSRGIVYIAPEDAPAGAQVNCTATSSDANDNVFAAEVTILVSE